MKTDSLRKALNACMKADATFQVRYSEYLPDQFTVPVKLTPKRIADLIGDFSVFEVKINIKP